MITLILLLLVVPLAQLTLMILIYAKSHGKIFRSASGSFAAVSVELALFYVPLLLPVKEESMIVLPLFGGFLGIGSLFLLINDKRTQGNCGVKDIPSFLYFIWGVLICIGLILWIISFSSALL